VAKQNQKFPFHFFFRFAVEGWGEETREKCKEIFWFLHTRVRERVRGALVRFTTQSGRTERFRATTRSARAISRQNPADFVRNTFELRPIHTALRKLARKGFVFVMRRGGHAGRVREGFEYLVSIFSELSKEKIHNVYSSCKERIPPSPPIQNPAERRLFCCPVTFHRHFLGDIRIALIE